MKKDLSILIPARDEMFLAHTIQDILENIEADTEVIAVLDGGWADPPVRQHERVNIIYVPKSIGQRAATNLACKLSKAKYVMKVDAHCSFDKGFDRKMLEGFKRVGDNVTMVPLMRNLWAFDWICKECNKGVRVYQDRPSICPVCGAQMKKRIIWVGKRRPQSYAYCFDSEPHFQYFRKYNRRSEYKKSLKKTGCTETMSLQGSCFMLTRKKY